MRKLILLVTVCVLVACLSLYIIDFRIPGDMIVGQQQDLPDDEQAGHYSEAVIAAPNVALAKAPEDTPVPTPVITQAVTTATAVPSAASESNGSAQTPTPSPAPKDNWALVWSDEFDKPALNMEYWTEMERRNNFNRELQYYTPANSYVKDGILYLEARKEIKEGKKYTSGMVQTTGKVDFQYGRFEARMKLPVGKGMFPAFWLLAYEGSSEIDVLEMIGNEPNLVYGVNHFAKRDSICKNVGVTEVKYPDAFHVYSVEWSRDSLKWYVDDQLYYSTERGIPNEKMYLIFNLAVGGVWPGDPNNNTPLPNRMAIDYVRYYQPVETTENGGENDLH